MSCKNYFLIIYIMSVIFCYSDTSSGGWTEEFPLHKCACAGKTQKLQELLTQGYSPTEMDRDSWAPIHYAAMYVYVIQINKSTMLHLFHCFVVKSMLMAPDSHLFFGTSLRFNMSIFLKRKFLFFFLPVFRSSLCCFFLRIFIFCLFPDKSLFLDSLVFHFSLLNYIV